jgi:hypothetical protein
MSRYLTLDSVVRDICAENNDPEAANYVKIARLTRRVLQEIDLHLLPRVEVKVFNIQENLSVDLPADCIDPIKVGYEDCNMIYILPKKVGKFIYEPDCNCTGDVKCVKCNFTPVRTNRGYGEMYGIKSGIEAGYWQYDPTNNRLVFNKDFKKIYVQYKSSLGDGDMQLIPSEAYRMISSRVLYFENLSKNQFAAREYEKVFVIAVKDYKRFKADHPLEELLSNLTNNYLNAPR